MKKKIHPNYINILAICSCGNNINTKSTIGKNIFIDVCNKCHPFYNRKKNKINKGGRVEKFNKKFNIDFLYKK